MQSYTPFIDDQTNSSIGMGYWTTIYDNLNRPLHGPGVRNDMSCVSFSNQYMIMFGGRTSTTAFNDLWYVFILLIL